MANATSMDINIKARGWIIGKINIDFVVKAIYSQEETLGNVFNKIRSYLENKFYPLKVKIIYVDGFTGYLDPNKTSLLLDNKTPITNYKMDDIINKGLEIEPNVIYEHEIISSLITCEYMNKLNTNNPLICPIYKSMREKSIFNNQNLNHLNQFTHFLDEIEEKPKCQYADECKSYIRCEQGKGSTIDDKCHMKLYRHPPRIRHIKLSENIHSLIINKNDNKNHALYDPVNHDDELENLEKYGWPTEKGGYLKALIDEIISNGYKYDLCLSCNANDECKHDIVDENNKYSILQIVNEKINCYRHKCVASPLKTDEMLALILYTGCDCNYDLCKSQRNGDYTKWKWFDYCLYEAIRTLSLRESGRFSVFSGLNGVKLNEKFVKCGNFVTYTSTSWKKEIAQDFMGNDKGMILQIDMKYKLDTYVFCCDVSWISKFPDECEILFARSVECGLSNWDTFECTVIDECSGVQTVSLRRKK